MSEILVVNSEYGRIRGVTKASALGTSYFAFLGIPYASPPVGEQRFKDPIPPTKWEGIYDATEEKSCCFAENFYQKKIVGSEDCLFLNIFSKNLTPAKLQPVMIYIHGGGFTAGSSSMDLLAPDYILMADAVVVTINYRLGAFGFMSFEDEKLEVPGNAAMKDQILAMKFVKHNIASFGGDPDNITSFGQSAGAVCTSWHCVSESSRGLFKRAIIMAGCVLNRFSLIPRRDWSNRLARKLGFDGSEEEKEILDFLRKADPIEIVKFQETLLKPDERGVIPMPFGPHIEPYVTTETFNNQHPLDLVRKAWSNDIDIFIGGTSDEGLMYLEYIQQSPALLKSLKLETYVPHEVCLSHDDPRRAAFVEKIRETYYPDGSDPTVDIDGFVRLKSDQAFWHGMLRLVRCRQNYQNPGKTFIYRFAVDSPTQNHYRIARLGSHVRGVCHADEISYLFKSIYVDLPAKESLEFKTIQRFVSLFTSFATTGNPNDNAINADMNNVQWEAVDTLEPPFKCLSIEESLKFEVFPCSERLAIWDEIYIDTNTPLY